MKASPICVSRPWRSCVHGYLLRSPPQRLSQQRGKEGWLLCPSSPPYESHLRRRPRPRRRSLARYYSGHVLFSFIFYGAEYGERERGRPRKGTLLGWKKEGRRAVWQGYSQLLHCVATPVPTGGFDWINTAAFIRSVTRFHSLSFGNSIWLFG